MTPELPLDSVERAEVAAAGTRAVPSTAPPRFRRPSKWTWLLVVGAAAFLVHGHGQGVRLETGELVVGLGRLGDFFGDAIPPDHTRISSILRALIITFEMALLGTILGVLLSIPIAVCAARNTSPHRILYVATRGVIALGRTIPDLVWGLIFVIAVGLGPQAGVLAIAADVIGFCGRFFAESMEEVDPRVSEGVRATGAPELGVIAGGVLPTCLPAFVATSMFAMESAVRSSVVLGLVGAGGIGIELAVSMQLLRFDEALTVILAIFVLVLGVERLSSTLRRRLI